MSDSDSFWLIFWELLAAIGVIIVIFGIIGEGSELLVKWAVKPKYKNFQKELGNECRWFLAILMKYVRPRLLEVETIAFAIVVLGLAAEFWGGHKSKQILDRNNKQLSLRVEELRKQNDDFEAGRYGRGDRLNWELFVKDLKDKPKWRAEVLYKKDDSESYEFARGFKIYLALAGWEVGELRPFSESDISTNWPVRMVGDASPKNMPLARLVGVGTGGILIISNSKTQSIEDMTKENTPASEFSFALMKTMINEGKNDSGMHFGGGWIDDERVPDGEIKIVVGQK